MASGYKFRLFSTPFPSSRLDRLLTLLENASSPVTRSEAARQLGEIQEKYPDELNTLLARISKSYLCHNDWDTRIAASDSIESIIDKVPVTCKSVKTENDGSFLTLDGFSLEAVLKSGSSLLACRKTVLSGLLQSFVSLR